MNWIPASSWPPSSADFAASGDMSCVFSGHKCRTGRGGLESSWLSLNSLKQEHIFF